MGRIESYKHSGKCGGTAIPLGLLFGTIAAGILAYIYMWYEELIPWIILGIIGTICFGLGIGAAASIGLRIGKCRNLTIAVIVGLACALVGEVASYHFGYMRGTSVMQKSLAEEFAAEDPASTAPSLDEIRETFGYLGYYRVAAAMGMTISSGSGGGTGGTNISGIGMYALWGLEFLLVMILAAVGSVLLINIPFCEACQLWTEKKDFGAVEQVDAEAVERAAQQHDLPTLLQPPQEEGTGMTLAYELFDCASCPDTRYLSMKLKWVEQKKRGKAEEKSKDVVERAKVTEEDLALLSAYLSGEQEVAVEEVVEEEEAASGGDVV